MANAAIVPAGTNGAINVFVSYPTDMLFDINGYFAPPLSSGLEFYPVTPCRIADTRTGAGFTGQFGPPSMAGGATRTFNIPSSPCAAGIPATVAAYSLNFTVVPPAGGPAANLTTWPTGQTMPNVSTLNYSRQRGGECGHCARRHEWRDQCFCERSDRYVVRHQRLLRSAASSGLKFYPVTPCRVADTRTGAGFSAGVRSAVDGRGTTRDFHIPSSSCAAGIPSTVAAYSLNFTVVPPSEDQRRT